MTGVAAKNHTQFDWADTAVSPAARAARADDIDISPLETEIVSIIDIERIERPLVFALIAAEEAGVSVPPLALHDAIRFAQSIPLDWPAPEIVVEQNGDVAFDWVLDSRRVLSVAIGPSGSAGYAALVGYEPTYGRVFLTSGIPETILRLMSAVRRPPSWQTH